MNQAAKQVAIVGVGLIGGSIGAALRKRQLCERVVGVGRNERRLEAAIISGVIDDYETDLDRAAADSEFVVVCTPVGTIADFSVRALRASGKNCIVTDGGSTKQSIVDAVKMELESDRETIGRFIGSHPIAGSEKSGHEAADSKLFFERTVVLTPDETTAIETTRRTTEFWQGLGANVSTMSAAAHDDAMASISHLPHLVASVLSAATPDDHLPLAAVGWGGTTRVASGDAELWRQIFGQNRQPLLAAIGRFQNTLDQFRQAVEQQDDETLVRILQQGKTNRDSLGN